MKKSLILLLWILPAALLSACSGGKPIAGNSTPAETANAIQGDRWTFNAQNANPQSGRSRFLTSQEFVQFSKDTLYSALPYFGRAFSGADIMTTQSVLGFKSTDFSFTKEQNNKGGWIITIKPRDYQPVQSYIFTLYDNGSAQLNVTLTNRSPISFTGTVVPR